MKEFEKLLLEDTKRRENEKALTELKLGLFEQKEEETFDFSNYTLITYGKKYKGLYDLYQNNEGSEEERKDLAPYAYDVLYLELLNAEEYNMVKEASVHENSTGINFLCYSAIALTCLLWALTFATIVASIITIKEFTSIVLLTAPLISGSVTATILLPILLMKWRKFKAE